MCHTHQSRSDADDAPFLELARNVTHCSCLQRVRTHLGDCLYPSGLLQHLGLAAPKFRRRQAGSRLASRFLLCPSQAGRLTLVTDLRGDLSSYLTILLLLLLALGVLLLLWFLGCLPCSVPRFLICPPKKSWEVSQSLLVMTPWPQDRQFGNM